MAEKMSEDYFDQEKESGGAVGVYLTSEEKALLDQIAENVGEKRHAIMQFGIKYFLEQYKQNPGIIEKQEKMVLKMPGED